MTQLEAAVEFASNPEPRCACVLLLDISGSMSGAPIAALNEGLKVFAADLGSDPIARQRVEVATITFGHGGVQTVHGFLTAGALEPVHLGAGGGTPMGEAIVRALEMVENRKLDYKANGIAYYRPWILMITDGEPTDSWHDAAARVHEAEERRAVAFFAVGVRGAKLAILRQIAVREPIMLDGLKFNELFLWLSQSQRSVSASRVGEQTALPAVDGWAAV